MDSETMKNVMEEFEKRSHLYSFESYKDIKKYMAAFCTTKIGDSYTLMTPEIIDEMFNRVSSIHSRAAFVFLFNLDKLQLESVESYEYAQ